MRESPVSGPRAPLPRLVGGAPCQKLRCAATPRAVSIGFKANASLRRTATGKPPGNRGRFALSALPVSGPSRLPDTQGLDLQFPLRLEQVVPQHDPAVLLANSQQGVGRRHHSGGGAGVPRPPASAAVSPTVVNISRLLSGNEAINGEAFGIRLLERRDLFVNLEGARTQAGGQFTVALGVRRGSKTHESVDNPGRAVAVLAAVLTHPRRIVRDPSRIGLRMFIEWRFEQQHPVRALNP